MSYHRGINKILEGYGYRSDTPSFQEICGQVTMNKVAYPYCYWHECSGKDKYIWKFRMQKWQRRCPDCGHELTYLSDLKPKDKMWKKRLTCAHDFSDGSCPNCAMAKEDFERNGEKYKKMRSELNRFGGAITVG